MQKVTRKRCRELAKHLEPNSAVIIFAADLAPRNRDIYYPYRQESNFYYLTGFEEKNSVFILKTTSTGYERVMFCESIEAAEAKWVGASIGPKGAKEAFNLDHSFDITSLNKELSDYLADTKNIFCLSQSRDHVEGIMQKIFTPTDLKAKEICKLDSLLAEMRLYKDEYELEILSEVADISSLAHINAMRRCKPGMFEYEIEALLLEGFVSQGCRSVAYESIVAAGKNACTLHYIANKAKLNSTDLLLVDAGAELNCYASDITRTYPIGGKFSPEQKAIYELVLLAQHKIIAAIKPGVTWDELSNIAALEITQGLIKLKILTGNAAKIIKNNGYREYYMHGFGHWLGLDVHDVGSYKNKDGSSRTLQDGMVFTVEPGIYISSDAKNIDKKWHNIGVRIEDDIAIIKGKAQVLTAAVPKEVAHLEHLVGSF
jgi:Xaa-Pro aminopeptidase